MPEPLFTGIKPCRTCDLLSCTASDLTPHPGDEGVPFPKRTKMAYLFPREHGLGLSRLELSLAIRPTQNSARSSPFAGRLSGSLLLQLFLLLLLTLSLAPVVARHLGQHTPCAFICRESGLHVAQALERTKGNICGHRTSAM
jgi:hypothetical protein